VADVDVLVKKAKAEDDSSHHEQDKGMSRSVASGIVVGTPYNSTEHAPASGYSTTGFPLGLALPPLNFPSLDATHFRHLAPGLFSRPSASGTRDDGVDDAEGPQVSLPSIFDTRNSPLFRLLMSTGMLAEGSPGAAQFNARRLQILSQGLLPRPQPAANTTTPSPAPSLVPVPTTPTPSDMSPAPIMETSEPSTTTPTDEMAEVAVHNPVVNGTAASDSTPQQEIVSTLPVVAMEVDFESSQAVEPFVHRHPQISTSCEDLASQAKLLAEIPLDQTLGPDPPSTAAPSQGDN